MCGDRFIPCRTYKRIGENFAIAVRFAYLLAVDSYRYSRCRRYAVGAVYIDITAIGAYYHCVGVYGIVRNHFKRILGIEAVYNVLLHAVFICNQRRFNRVAEYGAFLKRGAARDSKTCYNAVAAVCNAIVARDGYRVNIVIHMRQFTLCHSEAGNAFACLNFKAGGKPYFKSYLLHRFGNIRHQIEQVVCAEVRSISAALQRNSRIVAVVDHIYDKRFCRKVLEVIVHFYGNFMSAVWKTDCRS